jgi:hypothetical protein
MGPTTALSVVALSVALLSIFATAGLVRRLRELEFQFATSGSGGARFPDGMRPEGGPLASVLLVAPGCEMCKALIDSVNGAMAAGREFPISDRLALSSSNLSFEIQGYRHVVDPATFRVVNPGYLPALLVIDRAGVILRSTPVSVIEELVSFESAALAAIHFEKLPNSAQPS